MRAARTRQWLCGRIATRAWSGLLPVLFATVALGAEDSRPLDDTGQPLEELLVVGEQTGPGLWKVVRSGPSDGHVLWILGSYAPLPKKMSWRSGELEAALAASQEVLEPTSVSANVGPLRGLTLLPSLVGARNNPQGQRLSDVVPPELYARWLALKERYLGRDAGVEKWRPIFAAQKLYVEALRQSGLEPYGSIWPQVEKLARKHKVPVRSTEIEVDVDRPREAIKEFKRSQLPDLECFARTIERLESDLELMRIRANAWARGDIPRLRELSHVDQASACIAVVLNSQVFQERGLDDLPERWEAAWVAAASAALARNASTVAVLPIAQILEAERAVDRLRAQGYVVEDP